MSLDKPVLRTHKPSAVVPSPFVLVEGEEFSGKSWSLVELTKSPKVGQCFYLDLGEGTAEQYGAIPGADYTVLEHDGTYASVLEQILAVREVARAAKDAGDLPVVLLIDSFTDEWDGLKNWVGERAKAKESNKKKLRIDPAAELDVPRNLWNDVAARHARLMTAILTFPGIVVGTAKGKVVSDTDPATGQPYRDGRKTYRVDGQKDLAFQAQIWVRMTREDAPTLIGLKGQNGIRPGVERARVLNSAPDGRLLEWLIFEVYGYDPKVADVRQLNNLRGGELSDDEAALDPEVLAERRQRLLDQLRTLGVDPRADWLRDFGHPIFETTDLQSLAELVARHQAARGRDDAPRPAAPAPAPAAGEPTSDAPTSTEGTTR